jgi:catechol 2,3-dioxygenase-like lactoylglutathione lyase family enzyme
MTSLDPADYLIGLSHVGIVTEDLAAQVARLQEIFGTADGDIEYDENTSVKFAYFSVGRMPYEVIQPVSAASKVRLIQSGVGVNHVCYAVRDIEGAVAAMAAKGVRMGHVTPDGIVDSPGRRMAYFNPEDTAGVLMEFLEFLGSE